MTNPTPKIAHAIPDVAVNILSLFAISAILFSLNWQLMLVSLIPVPLIVFAMRGVSKYVRPAFRARQGELGELNATLSDNLSGIREIKAFTREEVEAAHVSEHIDRYRDSMLKALRMMATFRPFVEFTSSLGTVGLIYFGGRLALRQMLSLEDLVAFFLYLNLFCLDFLLFYINGYAINNHCIRRNVQIKTSRIGTII